MNIVHVTLVALLVALGTIVGILVPLLIYRSTFANREDDQIFLDPAERSLENEQRAIVKRMQQLGRPITATVHSQRLATCGHCRSVAVAGTPQLLIVLEGGCGYDNVRYSGDLQT